MSRLWYRQPAEVWEEALPLGNGRIGTMVFGGVCQERIQVNEESVWYGGAVNRINPDARRYLGEVREAIFRQEIGRAQELLNLAFAGCPDGMHPYQTMGDIRIRQENADQYEDYMRELDLEDAVCRVTFVSSGVTYMREYFASHPADCLIVRFTADRPGSISLRIRIERGKTIDGVGRLSDNGIFLYGNLGEGGSRYVSGISAWASKGRVSVVGQTLCVDAADEALLIYCADTSYQHKGEIRGERHWRSPRMEIQARRHWSPACMEMDDVSYEKAVEMLREQLCSVMDRATREPYEQLYQRHRGDYRSLYGRVKFELTGTGACDLVPTDERLKNAAEGSADPGLYGLLFDYGRYLLIACSREGGLPATLQGLWNESMQPPWDSKYTININTEMNYWPAECCNLSECHMPLFGLIRKMRKSGRRVAREMYGCRGFAAHHNTDIHGDCAPQDTWIPSTYWVMGAAWLCTHIWNHYEYTKDLDFLEEYYPVMCEAALFFLDFLVEKDGWLVTCPSSSPENRYRLPNGESGAVTYGAAMDNQILRDLFSECLMAAREVRGDRNMPPDGHKAENSQNVQRIQNIRVEDTKKPSAGPKERGYEENRVYQRQIRLAEAGISDEDAFLAQLREALGRLVPTRIGRSGRILEWIEDYEECEPGHRHISHLYGLHPSRQITVDGTPELAKAARATLEHRLANGGGHTGWSRAWIINHYAKLWDGDEALHNLKQLLASSVYPNLFDRHPPFQIDGNFGAAAAIAQMLVQSSAERIVLLPALPSEWPDGSVRGLRVRGNCEVDIMWEDHELKRFRLTAYCGIRTKILYEGKYREIHLPAGETLEIDGSFCE